MRKVRRKLAEQSPPRDKVMQRFLARYVPAGAKEYRPPVVDDAATQRAANAYLQKVAEGEAAVLEEIADLRFIG